MHIGEIRINFYNVKMRIGEIRINFYNVKIRIGEICINLYNVKMRIGKIRINFYNVKMRIGEIRTKSKMCIGGTGLYYLASGAIYVRIDYDVHKMALAIIHHVLYIF